MGMFSTIRSSYDLGPGFKKDLQTKDLDGLCDEYWIDPAGYLYRIDWSGTQDWEKVPENERRNAFDLFKTVPNGNKGKVTPCLITQTIQVYPAKWDAYYAPFPRRLVIFINGKVSDSEEVENWRERYISLKRWIKNHYEP